MDGRWGISIDVEGFSNNYEHSEERKTFAILALAELMNAIVNIGQQCYPGNPSKNYSDRLFVHQFGDGFIICSDFPEIDASRAIAIATAIMRHMILKGFATKAAISSGDMSDIKGCYPKSVRDTQDERVYLGMGLMTVISVMGTALTKAHKLSNTHRGAVLIVDNDLVKLGLPEGVVLDSKSSCIDWINSNLPAADEIASKSRLLTGNTANLLAKLNEYCCIDPVPPNSWVDATFETIKRIEA
jgi:hypothetical protein